MHTPVLTVIIVGVRGRETRQRNSRGHVLLLILIVLFYLLPRGEIDSTRGTNGKEQWDVPYIHGKRSTLLFLLPKRTNGFLVSLALMLHRPSLKSTLLIVLMYCTPHK